MTIYTNPCNEIKLKESHISDAFRYFNTKDCKESTIMEASPKDLINIRVRIHGIEFNVPNTNIARAAGVFDQLLILLKATKDKMKEQKELANGKLPKYVRQLHKQKIYEIKQAIKLLNTITKQGN